MEYASSFVARDASGKQWVCDVFYDHIPLADRSTSFRRTRRGPGMIQTREGALAVEVLGDGKYRIEVLDLILTSDDPNQPEPPGGQPNA